MEGTQIGAYKIERTLGRGGFGVVYVGVDTRLGRRAAIKQLLPELSGHRTIVERFFNEAKAAANINHPGIVEIYDVGWHTDGSAYFAMKLLSGDSLSKRLKSAGQLPVELACTIARQVASALGAAHAAGIVHRDLKPDNIILVPDEEIAIGERAVILDFGIAKLTIDNATSHTRSGMMMGTPKYMSPEQCKGAGEVDHRTDIYALGCILFEMLTGRVPFIGEGPGEIMGMHQFVDPPTVRSLRSDIPVELEGIITKLLAKKLDQRTQQMTDLQVALRPLGTGGKWADSQPTKRPSGTIDDAETSPYFVLPDNTDTAYHLPKDPVSVAAKAAASPPRPERDDSPPIEPPTPSMSPSPRPRPVSRPPPLAQKSERDRKYSSSVIRGEIDVPSPARSRRTLMIVLAGAAVVGIVIAIAVAGGSSSKPAVSASIDAAAPPPIDAVVVKVEVDAAVEVVDAVVTPTIADQQQIIDECKTATSDRDWSKLADCGRKLTAAGGAGDEFTKRAHAEANAEVALRNMTKALKSKPMDFRDATAHINRIPSSSVYYREAKDTYDPYWKDLVDQTVADLNAFAKDCAKYNAKARTVQQLYGLALLDEARQRAKSCGRVGDDDPPRKPCDGACTSDEKCEGDRCIAKVTAPPISVCDNPSLVYEAENKGDANLSQGAYAAAVQSWESILKCRPNLAQKIYLAACRARMFPKAKLYYLRFPAAQQNSMAQICMKEGYDPRTP